MWQQIYWGCYCPCAPSLMHLWSYWLFYNKCFKVFNLHSGCIADLGWCTCRIPGDEHVCQRCGCWREWNCNPFSGNRWVVNSGFVVWNLQNYGVSPCSSFSVGLTDEHFEIDSKTGDVRSTHLFIQTTETFYTLRITARDSGVTPQEETAVLHVQVWPVLHWKL